MTSLGYLTTIVGISMALGGVPQIIKIIKRKSAKDIAAVTYVIGDIGAFVWILYGIELKSFPIVLSNIIGMTVTTSILIGWWRYGREK